MFSRTIALFLSFVLSAINFVFLLSPLLLIAALAAAVSKEVVMMMAPNIFFFLIFCVLALMLVFFVLDWLFGVSVYRMTRQATPYTKLEGKVSYFKDLDGSFKMVRDKFSMPNVQLYVDQRSSVVNAYAIGSFRKKAIIVTQAFLAEVYSNAKHKEDPYDAIRGILGHEMSHLINKDFLPATIIMTNEKVTDIMSKLIWVVFLFVTLFVRWLPVIGRPARALIMSVYGFVNFVLCFVHRFLVLPIYGFLQKWLSRGVEYRCDRQSATAFGGQVMARGLSVFGEGSYFSIFSTHPRTSSRIEKVKEIRAMHMGAIGPEFMTRLANIVGVLLIIIACRISWELADIKMLEANYYAYIHTPIEQKLIYLQSLYNQWKFW